MIMYYKELNILCRTLKGFGVSPQSSISFFCIVPIPPCDLHQGLLYPIYNETILNVIMYSKNSYAGCSGSVREFVGLISTSNFDILKCKY